MKLYDAARCPYCARVRITLAEKGIDDERVTVDLSNRPPLVFELNPPDGRVPILDDGFILPESEVIMAYIEELHPQPALLPETLRDRAEARLIVQRFDDLLGDDYYAFRRGEPNDLTGRLDALPIGLSLFSDIAYVPWVIRARDMLQVELPDHVAAWLTRLEARPSVADEVDKVAAL